MNITHDYEDMQYFKTVSTSLPKERKEYCERTIKLLNEAHEIVVLKKKVGN
jgi:hypothetical protein